MPDVDLSYADVQRVLALLEHAPGRRVLYDDGEMQVTAERATSESLQQSLRVPAEGQFMRSPAVGIFRPSASLRAGAHLQAGDALGDIETLDLSNPVTVSVTCRVDRVLVEANDFVEFGQPLAALIKA